MAASLAIFRAGKMPHELAYFAVLIFLIVMGSVVYFAMKGKD